MPVMGPPAGPPVTGIVGSEVTERREKAIQAGSASDYIYHTIGNGLFYIIHAEIDTDIRYASKGFIGFTYTQADGTTVEEIYASGYGTKAYPIVADGWFVEGPGLLTAYMMPQDPTNGMRNFKVTWRKVA